jgi:hypothetical protein
MEMQTMQTMKTKSIAMKAYEGSDSLMTHTTTISIELNRIENDALIVMYDTTFCNITVQYPV